MNLTPQQYIRYSRHLILPEMGEEGQKKLLQAKVLIIGAGGLGSPLGLYLAAAGVGTIGLVDFDVVDLSNLQRQILHTNEEIGKSKLDSAEKRIKGMNPDTRVVKHEAKISSENAFEILRDYDLVIDGTDNFPTRYLVNDACVFLNKPNIYGSIFRFEGQVSVFKPKVGPCYRCLYPEPPPPGMVPSCAEGGVLGILPGVIGVIQATEAVKLIIGKGEPLIGRLLLYNALEMSFRTLQLKRDKNCPVCGDRPTLTQLIDYEAFCGLRRGEGEKTVTIPEITVYELKAKMDQKEDFVLVDVREPYEYQIARIPGSRLIPLGELATRLKEFEPFKEKEIIAHCQRGGRSARACELLLQSGFKKVWNVVGGITEWSNKIDPSVPKY